MTAMPMHRRMLVAAGVAAVVIAVAVLVITVGHRSKSTSSAHVVAVAFSPDRTVVGARVDRYYSPSCTRVRPDVERDGNTWRVKVRVEKTSDMCTMEMCADADAPAEGAPVASTVPFSVPDDAKVPGMGCKQYAIRLAEPAPSGVRLVPG